MMPHSVTSWGGVRSGGAAAFHDGISVDELQNNNASNQEQRKAHDSKHDQNSTLALVTVAFSHDLTKFVGLHREPPYRFSAIESMPFAPATGVTNG